MKCTFEWHLNIFSNIVDTFYSQVYSESYKSCVFPPIVHLARKPPFADLIMDRYTSAYISKLQNLTSYIPDITASWRESADEHLLDLLPQNSTSSSTRKGKGKSKSISGCLELATSFFNCHWCREPISYPRILMHHCLRLRRLVDPEEDDNSEEDLDQEVKIKDRKLAVWNKLSFWYGADWNESIVNDQVTFDDEASGFARVFVKACGEDPDTVTSDRMKEIDARVECLRCAKEGRHASRLVMNWTTAVIGCLIRGISLKILY